MPGGLQQQDRTTCAHAKTVDIGMSPRISPTGAVYGCPLYGQGSRDKVQPLRDKPWMVFFPSALECFVFIYLFFIVAFSDGSVVKNPPALTFVRATPRSLRIMPRSYRIAERSPTLLLQHHCTSIYVPRFCCMSKFLNLL